VNGGNIRGNAAYPLDKQYFTYSDLKTEVPFPCEVVVVKVRVALTASQALSRRSHWGPELLKLTHVPPTGAWSRSGRDDKLLPAVERAGESVPPLLQEFLATGAHAGNPPQEPPLDKGGFLQCDDGVVWDRATNAVTHIDHQPLDPERLYTVATVFGVINGMDNLEPIVNYRKAHMAQFPDSAEPGCNLKAILVSAPRGHSCIHAQSRGGVTVPLAVVLTGPALRPGDLVGAAARHWVGRDR
jgi:hypothetical protein